MKKIRILGILLIILAIAVFAVGVVADHAKDGDGSFAGRLASARDSAAAVDGVTRAGKNLSSLEKKISTAKTKLAALPEAMEEADQAIAALDEALAANETGNIDVDTLLPALAELETGMNALVSQAEEETEAAGAMSDSVEAVRGLTDAKVLGMYEDIVSGAYKAVSDAENAMASAMDGTDKVLSQLRNVSLDMSFGGVSEEPALNSVEDCRKAFASLKSRAEILSDSGEELLDGWYAFAQEAIAQSDNHKLTLTERVEIQLADNFIGVLFTAILLFLIGITMLCFAKPFAKQWRGNPVFSVGMALIVMLVLQTYALGFGQGSVGAWAKFWFDNTFNVLRANSSVGMIALGMTLVIITGGIDLAVGSTLAGVGTVLMTMIDTGDHGVLLRFGITGVPAFALGILTALITGLGIGAIIGLLVTKGRVPPFIVTLGIMNVVRSVSQYFTKSYTPTVPKSFEAIANTMIGGQRPMTILYWLVLAVIFYLVMKHTAFGRYVYAVGSNERTTRLSGINTNKVKMKVYMISGLVVAIAAVSQLSRLGGMDVASAGSGYELDAIAAVVVGGTAMSGGRGSIVGTVLGVLIIGIMNNLLILLGVDAFLTDAFKGAIVVAAVLMQRKEAEA